MLTKLLKGVVLLEIKYADLHTHTTASDGLHTPTENILMAKKAGLHAIAITDHDTVSGLEEAIEAGRKEGVLVVPGVEISTVANGQDIHVLGYFINYEDETFLQHLHKLKETRSRRNNKLVERLQQLGLAITMEEVHEKALRDSTSRTIGRPHIADVLVSKGYVGNIREAFDKYLGRDGKAYINPPRIQPLNAVDWIHQAGGKAIVAHPGLYKDQTVVDALIQRGIDGIEVYHSDHSSEEEAHYLNIANQNGLIVTAGSDFHGQRSGEVFHGAIGSKKINADVIDRLRI